ncbi:LEPR-XLL domain-containing protein, partial [Thermodesulfobacteriota bacterium]
MKRFQPPNPFELENLEPRILLSGDPLVGMVDAIAPDEPDSLDLGLEIPPLEEYLNSGDDKLQDPAYQQSLQYDPSQNLTDIFSGLDDEDPPVDQDEDSSTDTEDPVSLSEHSITEGEKSAIIQGMGEVANLGMLLQDFDAFGAHLPLIDATLGQLLGPYEVLDDRLSTPVYDYFQDAVDPPTTDGLLATLQGVTDTNDLVVIIDAVNGGYDANADEIRFDIDFQASRNGEVHLHAGPLTEDLGFEFEEGTQSDYTAVITFDFAFGVDLEGGRNEFFLEVNELTADLDITTTALNCCCTSLGTSPDSIQVVNGTVDLDAQVCVQFDKSIAGDGRITLAELRSITSETIGEYVHLSSTGTLFTELPLKDVQGDSDNPTTYIYISSEDVFTDTSPDFSVKTDISNLKDPILDLLTEFREIGENITSFEQLNINLPVIDSSFNQLVSEKLDSGLGNFLDLYTPALEYFLLLNVFNFNINDYLSDIGALPGIDIEDFNISLDTHKLKLKNLLEKEYNISLSQDWDLSLYLPEIWSLFNSDFEINDSLPTFQLLLGLPYVPKMNEVRSDIKTFLGNFPSLDGLMNYISTTSLTDFLHDFQGGLSQDPFSLSGMYDPASTEVRIDFMADAIKEIDFSVDLGSLFPDRFQELGISFDSNLAFTVTLGLNLDISASLSDTESSLIVREAAVTIQVNEEIDGLGVTVENLPDANPGVSEGRFDFDSRVEFVFHGLDPPAIGTLSLELPFSYQDTSQPKITLYITSDNIFDPTDLALSAHLAISPDNPNQTIGIGSGTSDNFYLDQVVFDSLDEFDEIIIGSSEGSHIVEIGSLGQPVYINNSFTISNPAEGGEVFISSSFVTEGDLTIIGSGHTTTIGGGNMVSDPAGTVTGNWTPSGETIINVTGDITISDAVVINGNVTINATGSITINSPGTITGTNASSDTLTLNAGTAVSVEGAINTLKDLTIISGTGTTLYGAVTLTGSLSIDATEAVVLQGAVTADGGFTSSGTTFDNTGGSVTVTDTGSIIIDHVGMVTIGAALISDSGSISITGTSVTQKIVFGDITSNLGGTILVTAIAGDISMEIGTSISTVTGTILYIAMEGNVTLAQLTCADATIITLLSVTLTDTVLTSGGFTSFGIAFDITVIGSIIAAGNISILHTGVVTLDGIIKSSGDNIQITGSSVNQNSMIMAGLTGGIMVTATGNINMGGASLSSTLAGAITYSAGGLAGITGLSSTSGSVAITASGKVDLKTSVRAGAGIFINGSIIIHGDAILEATAGDIAIGIAGGTIKGNNDGTLDTLTVKAGGNFTALGTVGGEGLQDINYDSGDLDFTPIGNGTGAYPNTTVTIADGITIDHSIILHGNVILEATAGDITIGIADGIIKGNNDGIPDTLTIRAGGTVTIIGYVGGEGLQDITIESATDVVFQDSVNITGSLGIMATGAVSLQGEVRVPGGFSSFGTLFDNTLGPVTVAAAGSIFINHTGMVSIGAELRSDLGSIIVTGTSVTQKLDAGNITSNLGGMILVNASAGDIIMESGSASYSLNGTIQYNATGNVLLAGLSGMSCVITAGTGGVTLTEAVFATAGFTSSGTYFINNAGGTIITIDSNITITHSGAVMIGALLNSSGIGSIFISGDSFIQKADGIMTTSGTGSISINALDGSIIVNSALLVSGAGNILLNAQGQGGNVIINSTVSSGMGNIFLDATGQVLIDEIKSTTTTSPGEVFNTSLGQSTLNLSDSANDGMSITITVLSNGNLKVSGSATNDNTTDGLPDITNIIGNPNADISLIAPDLDNVWDLIWINSGTLSPYGLSTITFIGVQNLTGGSGTDTFKVGIEGSLTGNLEGGEGTNTLRADINEAPSGLDELLWDISGSDSGQVTGLINGFTGFDHLVGWSGRDKFVVTSGVTFAGTLDGGAGDDLFVLAGDVQGLISGGDNTTDRGDVIDLSDRTVPVTIDLRAPNFEGIETIVASNAQENTLISADEANTWVVTGENDGTVNGLVFVNFSYLTGGAGVDTFNFTTYDALITGSIDGGAGTTDTLRLLDTDQVVGTVTGIEVTEDRSADIKNGLLTGLGHVSDLGSSVGGGEEMNTKLPIVKSSPVSLASLVDIGQLLSIQTAVSDYFASVATPTNAGIAQAISDQIMGALGPGIQGTGGGGPLSVTGGYYAGTNELRFDIGMNYSKEFDFDFDLGSDFSNLGLTVDGDLIVKLTLYVNFDISFGLDMNNMLNGLGLNPDQDVFVKVSEARFGAVLDLNNMNFGILGDIGGSTGTLNVVNGSISMDASLNIGFNGASGDGKLRLSELSSLLSTMTITPRGILGVHLPVYGSLTGPTFSTEGAMLLSIKPFDVFSGKAPKFLLALEGSVNFSDFFYANGSFAIQTFDPQTMALNDGTQVDVSMITIGGQDIYGFAGVNGPYFTPADDTNDNGMPDPDENTNESSTGFSISGVEFAAAFMKTLPPPIPPIPDPPPDPLPDPPVQTDFRTWTALRARVGDVRPVGLPDGITIAVQDLFVGINQGGGNNNGVLNTTVVDLATTPINVRTGVDETDLITLNFDGSKGNLLEAGG